MRAALNENKTVQIVVFGVLLVVVGLFLIMRMMGGGDAAGPSSESTATGLGSAGSPSLSPTGGASPELAVSAATGGGGTGPAVPVELLPPPPQDLVKAFEGGEAIALLVIRGGGIEDALVRDSVRRLEGEPNVAVFVVLAKDIARYAVITQGVNVTRVPALIVVRPRQLSGGQATATLSYGFRSAQSVVQAVRDALYEGGGTTYHPG